MQSRRSTRFQGKRAKQPQSDVESEPSVKRKRTGTDQSKSKQTKKAKARRGGKLRKITEMPLEILLDVFGHLRPLDLLHLARTTKALRNLVMSLSAKTLWTQALARVDGLPECPPDLTEPQYVYLAFDPHCHFCHTAIVKTVMWNCRVRSCKNCFGKNFTTEITIRQDVVMQYIPWEYVGKFRIAHFLKNDVEQYYQQWNGEDVTKEEFHTVESSRKIRDGREHARRSEKWLEGVKRDRQLELEQIRERRRITIEEKMRALDWGSEISMMEDEDLDSWVRHPLVRQSKDLTDHAWMAMSATLVEYLTDLRTRRLEREQLERMTKRQEVIVHLLNAYTMKRPWHEPVPGPGDVCNMDEFKAVVDLPAEVEVTEESFHEAMEHLPELSKQWLVSVERKLTPLLPPLHSEATQAHSAPAHLSQVRLAKTFYTCKRCHIFQPIDYHHILTHPCLTSYGDNVEHLEEGSDLKMRCSVMTDMRAVPWNIQGDGVYFDKHASMAAEYIIAACGQDPGTATACEMDQLDPRIAFDNTVMTWRQAVKHCRSLVRDGQLHKPAQPRLLSAVEVVEVKIREITERWTRPSIINIFSMCCARCREKVTGDSFARQYHLARHHHIDRPPEDGAFYACPGFSVCHPKTVTFVSTLPKS